MPSPFGPMTLGELTSAIEQAAKAPPSEGHKYNGERSVYFDWCDLRPGGLFSYRGYYGHLALSIDTDTTPPKLSEFLTALREADGEQFDGYKGGSYRMGPDTPVWVSEPYNASGFGVVGLEVTDWSVTLKTQKFD